MTRERPVLLLTNERDFAADRVVHLLGAAHVSVVRWNAESLGNQNIDWLSTRAGEAGRFRAVWFRQYLAEPPAGAAAARIDESLVLREQWRSWVATLDVPGTVWVNPLFPARRAENKVVQLRTATEVGLPVPATLVTSDPTAARTFSDSVAGGRSVVKSLASAYFAFSDQAFMFTEPLTAEILADRQAWAAQPLIVQAQIVRRRDIRVVVISGHVVAAALEYDGDAEGAGGSDWRLAPGRAWRRIDVPERDADLYRALVAGLGLTYGAIDLVDDGQIRWFLEINQAGEYDFLDRPLDLGIAQKLAETLAGSE